jgi:peptide chain release factor 2
MREKKHLDIYKENFDALIRFHEDIETLIELSNEGENVTEELNNKVSAYAELIEDIEYKQILSSENDPSNAYLTINSGAGGTDSQDWAEMLLRMYTRYAEKAEYKVTVIDHQTGAEAGIKNATIFIEGEYAYGFLKSESGVHRLVRISPFDSDKSRHTSFASVYVFPEIDDSIEVEINEKDIRIDTYRSSGAGGQHVNVTDSAVRITHMPTGIVVQCQNERSQIRNRETAMKMLKARIYEWELEKRRKEQEATEAGKKSIEWGSQIRSYVLHPYQKIKDHRTSYEAGDVYSVLDGDLEQFIRAYLTSTITKK